MQKYLHISFFFCNFARFFEKISKFLLTKDTFYTIYYYESKSK